MKKVMLFAVMMAGITSYSIAQDGALPEQSDKGQAIRTVAEGAETGKEKGQLVSGTASQDGVERSSEAKANGQREQEQEPEITSGINENASHGTDVKAVANDETLTGKAKGDAVKSVATSNPKARRNERAVLEKPSRPDRASRPERARRPATTGRPSVPGRP